MRVEFIVGLIVYMILMLGIAEYGHRRTKTISDYFIGGGTLSGIVTAFTYWATNFSAAAFMGIAGMAISMGLGASIWIAGGWAIGSALSWILLAEKYRSYSQKLGIITLPELYGVRYQSQWVRRLCAIYILIFLIPYMVAQFRGAGLLFEVMAGIPYFWSVLVFGGLIVVYTTYGGFKGVAYTDFVQGLLMVLFLFITAGVVLSAVGGFENGFSTFSNLIASGTVPEHLASPFGALGPTGAMVYFIPTLLAVIFCVPQVIIRFFAIKPDKIKTGMLLTGILFVISSLIIVIAFFGSVLYPNLKPADQVVPKILIELLPYPVAILLSVGLLGAMMSTVDSIVILGGSAITYDIQPQRKEKLFSVIGTAVVGIVALVLSFSPPGFILQMVGWSTGIFASAWLMLTIGVLYWKRMTKAGALTELIVAPIVMLVYVALNLPYGFQGSIAVSLLVATVCAIIVSLLTKSVDEKVLDKFFS